MTVTPITSVIRAKQLSSQRRKLAEWLRAMAIEIERGQLGSEPNALMLVVSGRSGTDVRHTGHHDMASLLSASFAAQRLAVRL